MREHFGDFESHFSLAGVAGRFDDACEGAEASSWAARPCPYSVADRMCQQNHRRINDFGGRVADA
jgi:hypothetical protein